MNWAAAKLGSLGDFKNGVNFTKDVVGEGRPLINVKDITGSHYFVHDNLDRVRLEVSEDALAKSGDLFFVRSSVKLDGIGLVGQLRNGLPEDGVLHCGFVIRFRPDRTRVNTDYLMYLLLTRKFRQQLKNLSAGAAIVNISQAALRTLDVPLPSLVEQERIATIVRTYDDLIENNRRRIQLLEQAARLLYKEWFVHLRFPGHEHVKITNGVPKGWTPRRLSELATKIGSGSTPRGGEAAYQSEGITLIRSLNVYDYQFEDDGLAYISDDQAERLSAVTVEPLDVLLNITGASVGRCCIVPPRHLPARVNQHVMIIRIDPNECRPHFVLHAINSHQQKEKLLSIARAGGATREALTKEVVQNIRVAVPPTHSLEEFEAIAGTLFEQGQVLATQNSQLARARDLLLPRLMNGEILV